MVLPSISGARAAWFQAFSYAYFMQYFCNISPLNYGSSQSWYTLFFPEDIIT